MQAFPLKRSIAGDTTLVRVTNASSRQLPEAGAVCGNSAHTDLCGGWRETSIPTATMIVQGWLDLAALHN